MVRSLLLASVILLVACQGEAATDPAATATRSVELTAVAEIQATAGTDRSITFPGLAPAPLPTPTPSPLSATPGPTLVPTGGLLDFLPALADLPAGFALDYEDADVTAPEITANYPDPSAHLDRLRDWGFAGSAYREFSIPSPGINDALQRMIIFRAQVSRYGSPESTDQALHFQLATTKARHGWKLTEVSVQSLGDETVALQGTAVSDGTTFIVVVLLVRRGDLLYRYEGASLGYNPYADVVAIAWKTLSRN
jgi:hypothetical protein